MAGIFRRIVDTWRYLLRRVLPSAPSGAPPIINVPLLFSGLCTVSSTDGLLLLAAEVSDFSVSDLMAKMLFWTDCDNNTGYCDATGNIDLTDSGLGPVYATGVLGGAFDFPASQVARITPPALGGLGTTGFTCGIFIKSPISGGSIVFGQWPDGNKRWALRQDGSDYILSVTTDGSTIVSVVAGAIPGGTGWHSVMGWYDPVADLIYASLDNGTPNSAAFASALHTGSTVLTISSTSGGAETDLDFAFIAEGVLSATERTWLYNGGAGRDWIYPARLLPMDAFEHTLTAGGLTSTNPGGDGWMMDRAVGSGRTSGKFYFEMTVNVAGNSGQSTCMGVVNTAAAYFLSYIGIDANGWGYIWNGDKAHSGSSSAFGASYTNGDVIGCAFDITAGKVWFSKNGTWQASGDPAAGTNEAYSGLSGRLMPAIALYYNADSVTVAFADADLTYAPPTGFVAWEQVPA